MKEKEVFKMVQHMIKLLEDDNVLPEVIPKDVWLEISSVEDLPIEFIMKHKDRFKYSTLVSKYAFMQEVHT